MKCIGCGSTSLISGALTDGSGGKIAFMGSDVPSLRRALGLGTRPISGYGCTHCGQLQFKVDFSESDIEAKSQFEGEQPPLLDRLKSEESGPGESESNRLP